MHALSFGAFLPQALLERVPSVALNNLNEIHLPDAAMTSIFAQLYRQTSDISQRHVGNVTFAALNLLEAVA